MSKSKSSGTSSGKPAAGKTSRTTNSQKPASIAPKTNIRSDKSTTNSGGPRKK